MSVSEIKALPLSEKLQIMEMIWEDLKERFENTEISPQLKALLEERRARVQRGEARLIDWNAVKGNLGKM